MHTWRSNLSFFYLNSKQAWKLSVSQEHFPCVAFANGGGGKTNASWLGWKSTRVLCEGCGTLRCLNERKRHQELGREDWWRFLPMEKATLVHRNSMRLTWLKSLNEHFLLVFLNTLCVFIVLWSLAQNILS